ncbi:hypothetical protein CERSUDRAFT_103776 [Gelatoporia subvermispora B]|uniref:HNH domain-containing protein n=1 Tax=Ceriporiopsis subvermispora (strain B) TaxID=914234 RepID=M2RLU5_CERS8|nr:hypothetical protein CERSUDRAFT_103776 [Gelatoporia subvermispora B]
MVDADITPQFTAFKDALARRFLAQPGIADADAESDALDDYTSYLASEVWPSLAPSIRAPTYESRSEVPDVDSLSLNTTPASFADTLISCGIAEDPDAALDFLRKTLSDYIADATAPPPVWSKTRTSECEICEREVPLTYHHLIPRQVHAKVLKKGWHPQAILNSVAWLCRPCHSVVHQVSSNEELARSYYTVEMLLQREDIQRWRKYASKQRWGLRRGCRGPH